MTVHDPWLLNTDFGYQICLPKHGNTKIVSFSASGLFVFVLDTWGRLYTKRWNMDLGGYNQIYCRYKY